MIYGERVKQAREFKNITQTDFGRRIDVKQSTISKVEKGITEPSANIIENIVLQTSFPLSFFKQPLTTNFSPSGGILFRAKRSVPTKTKQFVIQHAKIIFEMIEKLEDGLETISVNIPSFDADPIEAAQITRLVFGLRPDAPISNLIGCLERNGILVLILPMEIEDIDAFCAWGGKNKDRPIIVARAGNPTDRLRFSVAHELGHLVMHKGKEASSAHELDEEAFSFAGEFLMPASKIQKEITRPVSLYSLAKLKPRWRVAIQAMVRRAKDLRIITARQYSYLNMQISANGWKKREPSNLDISPEKPRVLSKVVELVYGKPLTYRKIASEMCLPLSLVKGAIEECTGVEKTEEDDNITQARISRLNTQKDIEAV